MTMHRRAAQPRSAAIILLASASACRALHASRSDFPLDTNCTRYGYEPRGPWDRIPRVFDSFLFNLEKEILSLRMLELQGVVDTHVYGVTEETFKGVARTSKEMSERTLMGLNVKQVRVGRLEMDDACQSVTECPKCKQSLEHRKAFCWQSFARNALARGPESLHAAEDDWVLVSDVDEIPDRAAVAMLKACKVDDDMLQFLSHAHYVYSTQCQVTGGKNHWTLPSNSTVGPVAMRVRAMRKHGLQAARKHAKDCWPVGPYGTCTETVKRLMPPSAWHLSSFERGQSLVEKVKANADHLQLYYQTEEALSQNKATCTDPKGYLKMQKLSMPARHYPDVPRALADHVANFRDMLH